MSTVLFMSRSKLSNLENGILDLHHQISTENFRISNIFIVSGIRALKYRIRLKNVREKKKRTKYSYILHSLNAYYLFISKYLYLNEKNEQSRSHTHTFKLVVNYIGFKIRIFFYFNDVVMSTFLYVKLSYKILHCIFVK